MNSINKVGLNVHKATVSVAVADRRRADVVRHVGKLLLRGSAFQKTDATLIEARRDRPAAQRAAALRHMERGLRRELR